MKIMDNMCMCISSAKLTSRVSSNEFVDDQLLIFTNVVFEYKSSLRQLIRYTIREVCTGTNSHTFHNCVLILTFYLLGDKYSD